MTVNTQQTLLQMTQEILTSMQSDEVDSITDTAESVAVATIIRRTYWDLFGLDDFPEHYSIFKLTETSSATPNLLTIPENCRRLMWVKYNRSTVDDTDARFTDVDYTDLKSFLDDSFLLTQSADNVASYTYTFNPLGTDPVQILTRNDIGPQRYCSPDDFNLIFDSYDAGVESYLHSNRTLAYGLIDPTFTFTDAFTPDLDVSQYALLFNTAKSQCFVELKQTANVTADQRARRLMINAQKTRNRAPAISQLDRLPNYGRTGPNGSYEVHGYRSFRGTN